MRIEQAAYDDLEQILKLQYLAYQSEARLNNNYFIPPLLQTLENLQEEYRRGRVLKAVNEDNLILGSVRGYVNDNTLYIGKLIVHPEQQGKGIGTKLLISMEQEYPGLRYELFTSSKSLRNLSLYERLGYVRFKETQVSAELVFVYLEKSRNA